jgi:hypothetical protein
MIADMTRKYKISTAVTVLAFSVAAAAASSYAEDKKFEVSLDKNRVAIGEKAQLGVSFYGTQNMPAPDITNIEGIDVRYVGPSTMMTVLNGQVSTSITHLYNVQALKIGKFQIGPFAFKYKGDNYTSNPVFLEVVEEKITAPARAQTARSSAESMNLADRMFLVLAVDKPVAYVNELIPVTVRLYVNRLNVSDIQLPTFEQESFSKVEFKEPKQFRERMNGLLYDVLEFKTSIFGTKAGDYRLGPAAIKCNVMIPKSMPRSATMADDFFNDPYRNPMVDDFFMRYERQPMELKSRDVQLGILPVPAAGRPQDYSGAVGDYQFIYTAGPTKLKTGDPITLKMDINGTGNLNTVLMPKLGDTTGFKVYEAQVKTEENRKSFTQVLIPESESVTQVPKATFSYFDPVRREFKSIAQGPIPIKVEKPKEEAPSQVIGPAPGPALAGPKAEGLGRDIIYIKDSPGRWRRKGEAFYRTGAYAALYILPLLLLIALYLYQSRMNRIRSDSIYANRVSAFRSARREMRMLKRKLKGGDPKVFYEGLFNALQDYLGYRLSLPSHGLTSDVAERALEEKGVPSGTISDVRRLFEVCDTARFAFHRPDGFTMRSDMKALYQVVKYLERSKI